MDRAPGVGMNFIDMAPGTVFDRLTVLRRSPESSPDGEAQWACRCLCGSFTTVRGHCLRSGATRSCGCIQSEYARSISAGHWSSRPHVCPCQKHFSGPPNAIYCSDACERVYTADRRKRASEKQYAKKKAAREKERANAST